MTGDVTVVVCYTYPPPSPPPLQILSTKPRRAQAQATAAAGAGDAIAAAPRRSERRSGARASRRLKIGIIGFGKFGQFISRKFVMDHDVVAMGRGDYTAAADEMGASLLLVRVVILGTGGGFVVMIHGMRVLSVFGVRLLLRLCRWAGVRIFSRCKHGTCFA